MSIEVSSIMNPEADCRRTHASFVAPVLAVAALCGLFSDEVIAADAAAEDSSSSSSIQEIVVTARRKDESLANVPVSVVVLSEKTLNQHAISNSFDLNKAVPGLTVQANNGSTSLPSFAIRGRGQNYGAATGSVETYFADVPLSPPFQEAMLPPQFFDVNSFQVLKGPQGTLFGRNTTGGAVLIVPTAPTDQWEGYARAQFGDYNDRQYEGAINMPLSGDGRVDLRIAAYHWARDGYMHTIGGEIDPLTARPLPSQDFMSQDTSEARATLRIRPFDGFENSTILTYHYDRVRVSTGAGLNIGGLGTFVTVEPLSGFPVYQSPYYQTRFNDTSVNLDRPGNTAFAVINTTLYKLNYNLSLKNIFGYINAHAYTTTGQDVDGTVAQVYDTLLPPRRNANYQYTNEVQLQGNALDHRLSYTVGGLADLTREPGLPAMNYQDNSVAFGQYSSQFEQNNFSSYSGFASGTFAITDQLNLSAGFRHTWDSISQRYDSPPGALTPDGLATYADPATTLYSHKNFGGNTYNIGLDFHPTQHSMVYGGYRRGYKRGGFSASGGNAFAPETVDSFNLGFKQDFVLADSIKGRYSIEGFYDLYHDMQSGYVDFDPVTFNFLGRVANIPKTRFRGVEAEWTLEPTAWVSLQTAFSFIDAAHTSWPDTSHPELGTQDLTVNPVPNVSKYKGSATLRFHTIVSSKGDEIALAPSINAQSKFYTGTYSASLSLSTQNALGFIYGVPLFNFNQIAVGGATVPGYSTVDLRAEWNHVFGTRLSLAGNVTNLTNKYYLLYNSFTLNTNVGGLTVGPPRMWFLEGRYDF